MPNIWFVSHPHVEPTVMVKELCPWNVSCNHKRKLICSDGAHYLDNYRSTEKDGTIYFAGEWECCSFFEKNRHFKSGSTFKNVHEPVFTELDSQSSILNTDPFVLGKKIYYVCCGKNSKMNAGDIVIFGTTKKGFPNKLHVDTVLVLEGKVNRFDNQQCFFPSGYNEVTLSKVSLHEDIWVGQMYEDDQDLFSFVPCKMDSDFSCPVVEINYKGKYLQGGQGANHLSIPDESDFMDLYEKIIGDIISQNYKLGVYMPMPKFNSIIALKSPEDYDSKDYYNIDTHRSVELSEIFKRLNINKIMKKFIFTIVMLLSTVLPSWASESVMISKYKYKFMKAVESNGKLIADENSTDLAVMSTTLTGNIEIPSTITIQKVTYTVRWIGENAFKDKTGITSVKIPDTVTSIGNSAFSGCTGLTSIEIPSSVTTIGEGAFKSCSDLTSIEIPSSVTTIGEGAFKSCSDLTSIEIPNSVTSISDNAFRFCTGLKSVEIPTSVTTIGKGAFFHCTRLTSIEFPNSVTSICDDAFYECTGLTSIEIPNSVISICEDAFYGCIGLTSVEIPTSVTYLSGFRGCTGLTSIEIPGSVTTIGEGAFSGCTGLTSIEIPNSVTYLSGFGGCTGLTSIEIPNSVTTLGKSAFSACTGLTYIEIPNSVISIGMLAFYGCTGLRFIKIPNSVTSIGQYAFNDCENIDLIISEATTPPSLGSNFSDTQTKNIHLYVPENTSAAYKSSISWGKIENIYENFGEFSDFSDFEYNGISYRIISVSDMTVAVTAKDKENTTYSGDVLIPETVTYRGRDFTVTEIDNFAFYKSNELSSITIPQTVVSIDKLAFIGATLKSIIIEKGDSILETNECFENSTITSLEIYRPISDAFQKMKLLSSVKVGGNFTSIKSLMFEGCQSLTTVEILDSVTSIGESAFSGCSNLTSLTIGNEVTSIGESAFSGCSSLTSVEIPHSVTSLGDAAFQDCTGLMSATIGDKLDSIGKNTFNGCAALTSITIGKGVTSIGEYAFIGCFGLTDVYITDLETWCKIDFDNRIGNPMSYAHKLYLNNELVANLVIPNTITTIKKYAFYGCDSLTSVEIPNSVTSIEEFAFSGCIGLTSVEIPNSVTSIGESAFYDCNSLTSVIIGSGSIGTSAFSNCESLTSVVINNGVTSIGKSAFSGCRGLTSVVINNGVSSIEESAFSGCSSLISVVIPGSVGRIGRGVFDRCTSLSDVAFMKGYGYYGIYYYEAIFNYTSIKKLYWNRKRHPSSNSSGIECGDVFSKENLTGLERLTIGGNVETTDHISVPSLKELILESGDTDITFEISDITVNPIEKLSINRNGTYNFSGITTLKELRVGSDIKTVTNGDFTAASEMMNVYCTATTPPTGVTFSNDTYLDGTLYVKKGCKEAYEAADGWKQFWTIVDNLPFEVDGLWYQPQDDGTVMLVASPTGDSYADTVLVPATVTYEGVVYEVSSIAHDAFGNAVAATELKIEDGTKPISMNSSVAMTTASTNDEMTGIFSTSRIEKVYVGRDLKYTVDNAPFASLATLKDVTVGANVTSMGGAMFAGCKNITSVSSYATVPPADAEFEEVVYSRASLNLLPDNSVLTAYKAAEGWKNFFTNGSDISGIDDIRVDENNDGADATDDSAEVEYYNLQGMKVNADNLGRGIYIKKQGKSTKKIFVK